MRPIQPPPRRLAAALLGLALAAAALPAAAATVLTGAVKAVMAVRSADPAHQFLGSAFLWQDGTLAVTNAHVVDSAAEVELTFADGSRALAEVLARDPRRDIAVLKVGPGHGPGLSPAARVPELGEEVYAIGAPLGIEQTVTRGIVSNVARQIDPTVPLWMVQHDAAVNPGNSGGPLIDAAGHLLGMNSQIADGSRYFIGISYAIAAGDIARLLPRLLDGTLRPVPELGLLARPMDQRIAAALGVPDAGLLVDEVRPGGLADAAGLRPGDVMVAAGGSPLAQPGDLAFRIDAAAAGPLELAVLRGGKPLQIVLPLERADALAGLPGDGDSLREISYRLPGLGVTLADDGSVATLTEASPARLAGLAHGDRILAVNGTPVAGAEAVAALRRRAFTRPILLLVARADGDTLHILVDPWDPAPRIRPVGGANVLDPEVIVY